MALPIVTLDKKTELRQYYRKIRSGCTDSEFAHWNQLLNQAWLSLLNSKQTPNYVGIYAAKSREANPFRTLPSENKLCFPIEQGKSLDFLHVENPADPEKFQMGAFGIQEPIAESSSKVAKNKISVIYLPLLAFDQLGTRLGHGGGYYDRYCADFKGKKVGIALDWQFSYAPIPREAHDVVLDEVLTPTRHLIFPIKKS